MKIDLSISYEVEDADPEAEAILAGILDEEAREFARTVHTRLESEGVRVHSMRVDG